MDDAQLGQLETDLLNIYVPGMSKQHRKALRKLCKEKKIKLFDPKLRDTLCCLLASIIRHRETDYESMCAAVGKKRARFYVQPIVGKALGDDKFV